MNWNGGEITTAVFLLLHLVLDGISHAGHEPSAKRTMFGRIEIGEQATEQEFGSDFMGPLIEFSGVRDAGVSHALGDVIGPAKPFDPFQFLSLNRVHDPSNQNVKLHFKEGVIRLGVNRIKRLKKLQAIEKAKVLNVFEECVHGSIYACQTAFLKGRFAEKFGWPV
jgi:hypothetical protein